MREPQQQLFQGPETIFVPWEGCFPNRTLLHLVRRPGHHVLPAVVVVAAWGQAFPWTKLASLQAFGSTRQGRGVLGDWGCRA